jgi:hypothetical protein
MKEFRSFGHATGKIEESLRYALPEDNNNNSQQWSRVAWHREVRALLLMWSNHNLLVLQLLADYVV